MNQKVERAIHGLRTTSEAAGTARVVVIWDPLQEDNYETALQKSGLHTYPLRLGAGTQKRGPCLIDIPNGSDHERFINHSLRTAVTEALAPASWNRRFRSVCAWLITNEKLGDLGHVIARRAHLRDETDTPRTFRHWDPRAMQHAAELYGSHDGNCGMIGAYWGLIDSFGDWRELSPATPEAQWRTPPLATLRLLGLMNTALQCLAMQAYPSDPKNIWDRLRTSIRVGEGVGLSQEDDLAWFAADRVRLGKPLERAGSWAALLARIRAGKARYVRATADFDEDDWQSVVKSIPSR